VSATLAKEKLQNVRIIYNSMQKYKILAYNPTSLLSNIAFVACKIFYEEMNRNLFL